MTEETLFAAALEKRNPADRSAFLDEACADDPALRQRVEVLLQVHEKVGDFLERPAVARLATAAAPTRDAANALEPADDALDFLQPSTRPGSLGRLGHYEVLEVLGRGGFGIVLKAFDDVLHRVVAIKVMSPQLASTSPARKRFLREARAAAAVRHDNVVGIHAIEEQPIPYLVMEYIAGETLQQKLDRSGPLEAPEVLCIGRQIARGLAAAHALGLIHRDVKPANILLENGVEQRIKITDFGLARTADDASLTQSGVVAGTPMYMAPEQAAGEAIDQRADLFSLGSVLYVMCTGRPPFRAATTLAVLKRVAEDTPRPIREIIPEVPEWLCAFIARLHAKKPEDRFASAKEVDDLLGRHLAKLQQDRGQQPHAEAALIPLSPLKSEGKKWLPSAAGTKRPTASEPGKSASPKTNNNTRRSSSHLVRWAATTAAAVFLLLVGLGLSEATGVTDLHGTVIRLFSPEGTLVVEVDDPDVSVTIDGGEMVITGAGAKEIRLKPGQYKLQANKEGKLVRQELITVTKNGRLVVRVSKEAEPGADSVTGDKSEAASTPKPPARQALDLKYIPADASAAVVIYPRRILQSPVAAAALPPASADEMVKELGVKPEQIDQVIVLLQPGAAAPAPKDAPAPGEPTPDPTPIPGAVIRFAEPVDGKAVLTHLLKGLREEHHDGKTYYRTSTGEELLGLPLAGALPDERTVLVAPEPVLRKMLAADGGAKSPLLDRLRQSDAADDITGVVLIEPHRALLKTLVEPFKELLPPDLADAASLPDRVVAATATVNLSDKTLLKVSLEADAEESVEVLDKLAFKGLNWARKVYPDFRPTLLKQIPAEVVQPALAVADQIFGGIQVAKEEKRLVIRLEKPESLDAAPESDLIASSGFNDAEGMNSNPLPGSPFLLDTPNREGGAGEPGWAGPWSANADAVYQGKVVFEGDGALYLKGRPNFGPYHRRVLAVPQTGRFQVEYHVQVPAGTNYSLQLWPGFDSGPFSSGPISAVENGKFIGNDLVDTGFKCEPGRWYKVTMRIDVPKQTWELFVDDQRFDAPKPLKFRAKVEYLSCFTFIMGQGGAYFDDLRVTRLPDDAPKDALIASSGFNNAKGMNSNPVPGSPFPLDAPNREGGTGEPGWAGPWGDRALGRSATPAATFQTKVVFEGDGALHLTGDPVLGPNYGRQLAQPQTGRFQVEYHVQAPAGSSCDAYVWQGARPGAMPAGPVWGVGNGKFSVHGVQDTGFKCEPERWYKVTMKIDVPKQTWEFFVDDQRFESPKPLQFKEKAEYLDYISFLVRGGMYIDAVRVTRLPDAPPPKDLIASAGFNDAQGMNSNPVPGSPYPLDSEGKQGGVGEPGWAGPWSTPSSPKFTFQKKVVHEGDGALYMSKEGADRRLAEAQRGSFGVEMFVQAPERGGFLCYLNNAGLPFRDGPVWSVKDGKFLVLDGPDNFRETGFTAQPGKWHKVVLRVDVSSKEWQFFVDDVMFETPKPLRFRSAETSLDTIRFQCETEAGIYVDALRFMRGGLITPPPKDLIASTGFNNAKGLHSDLDKPPFPLDASDQEGGAGEPGWAGPWLAHPKATFQSKVVFEGDGALYLEGSPNVGPNYGRQLAKAQTGRFQVEYYLQAPAGSSFGGYVWQDREGGWSASGPNWGARNGKFNVHGQDTDFKCVPGQWYKVMLRIDVAKQTWEFFVDDKRYESPQPLKFRTKVQYLDYINFLVEGGVYIDDLRVTRLPDADTKP